jgi:alpha/beta superfamily hydrolase
MKQRMLVLFSHGKESGPQGSKIRALMRVAVQMGAATLSVNYREYPDGTVHDQNAQGEAERRVSQLLNTPLPNHDLLVLVGSSMGGYVSTLATISLKVDGLFLLAPAFYIPGYVNQAPESKAQTTTVVHGWHDDVVPFANSLRFCVQSSSELHLLSGDHRLNAVLPKIEPLFAQFLQDIYQPETDE